MNEKLFSALSMKAQLQETHRRSKLLASLTPCEIPDAFEGYMKFFNSTTTCMAIL